MAITYHSGRRIQATQADFDGTPAVSGGWKELARTTLGSNGDSIDVSSLADKRYLMFLLDSRSNGTAISTTWKANGSTGNEYSFRRNHDGTEGDATTQPSSATSWTSIVTNAFGVGYAANKSGKEKLFLEHEVYQNTAGAGTAPTRTKNAFKWTGTDHNLNLSWVLDTTYYVQLERDGASFSATVWTGSYNGTEVASGTDTIGGTVSGLQYFGVKSPVTNRGGSFSGWLDDLKIYDGILPTSLTNKPTDVQDNSLLVEKDTARRYWFSDEFSKSNCKAYFTLDETSGNPANHTTSANGFSDGNGINGTNGSTGATQNITGKFDKCFEFSGGNNEQVDMGNTILSGTTDFTLSGWINSSITSSGTYVIFNSYLSSATAGIQLYINGSGNIIYWTSTGSITTSTATSGSNNSWDHVVVTKEGTSVKIYLNGAVDVSGTINHSITGGNFSIGGRSDGLYCFKGKIDEASVWTRALSASEISELYNSGTGKTLLEAKTATWTMQSDWTDDFSSDNWTNIEGTNVGVSGGVLAYNAGAGAGDDGAYRDYGSVVSETFVWRFTWNATNISKGSHSANNEVNFGISSNTLDNGSNNDAVGILLRVDSNNKQLNAGIWKNDPPDSTAPVNTALEPSTFADGVYYVEIVRQSNRVFTITLYSDSSFSTSAYTTTLTNNSDLDDLRYFKVTTDHETSADSVNNGSLDNFEFYNGVTSVN